MAFINLLATTWCRRATECEEKYISWPTIYFWSTSHQRTALLPHLCLYFCSNLSSQFVSSSSKFSAYSRFLSFCRLSVLPVLFFTKKLYLFHFCFPFLYPSIKHDTYLSLTSQLCSWFLITLYLRVPHLFILSSWNSCKLFLPAFHAFCGAFSLVTWNLGVFIRCPALWAVFIPLPLYSGYLWLVWIYFSFKKNPILTPSCVIGKESTYPYSQLYNCF